jgi:four helix bundle protein
LGKAGYKIQETRCRIQDIGNRIQETGERFCENKMMKKMSRHNFKNLDVWKLSRELCKEVYEVTTSFPTAEKFALTSQIRRCVISISSNIAEGTSRTSDKDFARFIEISLGSCFELETQIILANDIGFLNEEKAVLLQNKLQKIQKMLQGLYNRIQKSNS